MKGLLTWKCVQVTDDGRNKKEETANKERGDFMAADGGQHEASVGKPRGLTSQDSRLETQERERRRLAVLRNPYGAWDGGSAVPGLLWS